MPTTRPVHILLVEDEDVDVMAIERAFRRLKIANELSVARDGIEALELLRGTDTRPPLARPFIMLLDLNLPRMNGIELLRELRADPSLHDTVVFVLTTSNADKDRAAAYDQNIAGYIVKTDVGAGFMDLISMLGNYWRVVELPA